MNDAQLAACAQAAGFSHWATLDVSTIVLKQEVRDMCATNSCGRYGKCWSCPPGCGSLEDCKQKLSAMSRGILVQTVGDMEDSFDFEAMMEVEAAHKAHFTQMYEALRASEGSVLALGTGCCTQCASCTYPDAPCRFPEKMVSSMEAFGILVLEVCQANGLNYYYGSDQIAYTACFLLP